MRKEELLNKISELKLQRHEIDSQIVELKRQKDEVDKHNSKWSPIYLEKYWWINNDGFVTSTKWYNQAVDNNRLAIGNAFKTKEEAVFQVERLKVIVELKKYSSEFNTQQSNHFLFFDHSHDDLDYNWVTKQLQNI